MREPMMRCARCLLPSSLPGMVFDIEGVCNHCRNYERDYAEWDAIADRKRKEFASILNFAKDLKRPYDCLVPLSGGKDSTYALYLATKEYGLKTLAVTFDNGYMSSLAKENIENALVSCDADHVFYHMNRQNSAKLFTAFLSSSGDFCNACMRGINYSIEVALKSFHIPLVIKGSGRRVQYLSQLKNISTLNTPSYFLNVIKETKRFNQFKHMARHRTKLEWQKIAGGITDIVGLPRTVLMRNIPQHIGMYDYIYVPLPDLLNVIKIEMGGSDGGGAAEHLDCELHDVPFHKNTLLVEKITKSTLHNSGLLRQGLISKDQALEKERKDLESESIPPELIIFLADNNLTYDDYERAVRSANREQYAPRIQKIARTVYHRLRKF